MPREPTLLRVLLTGRHWQKFETFEVQFRRAARDLSEQESEPGLAKASVSSRQFERWYAGQVRTLPLPDACRVLEHMFGQPVQALLGPASTAVPAPRTGEPAAATLGQDPAGRDDPERTIAMAARRAIRFSASADASNVGTESLDQYLAEAGRLAVAYPQQPLAVILADIAALQDQTMTLLEGRQRPGEARGLYLIAGLASGMLAKASHDMRDPHTAMTHARTALLCARNAEHPALTGWVRGLQSLISYWAARPREALEYALAGEQVTGISGTISVWLPALEARAWSALGSAADAARAIEKAARARDEATSDDLDQLGGMCHFARARQLYYAADAGAMLPAQYAGSPEGQQLTARTAVYASDAISAYEHGSDADRSFGDEAGSRADLAIARIRTGDLDGASDALAPVLDMPAPLRIHGVLSTVIRVHQALTPAARDAAIARDLQEQIEGYCHTPAAALPR